MLEPSTRRVSIYFSLDYRYLSAIDKEITIKFWALLRPYEVNNNCLFLLPCYVLLIARVLPTRLQMFS